MEAGIKVHTKGRYMCGRNALVDGDEFSFKGEGGSVGVVKIMEPMSPILNYFEYEILSRGVKCAIGLGVGDQPYPLDRMPGWNRNGIGYHADDGRLFHQDGYGKPYGLVCTEGDRMGCGVDFNTDAGYGYVEIFFTKNSEKVGGAVRMKRPIFGLYPLIGMHSRGEKVRYLGHWHRTLVSSSLQEPMVQDHSPSNIWLRSNGVKFLDDSLTLEYNGDGLNRQDVGIAQAKFSLDRQRHYFEMDILASGKDGWLAIGLAKSTYPLHRHPGWNQGSVGYHADNGHLYKERGHGEPFGPKCTEGDVMGCGIQFPADSTNQDSGAVKETTAGAQSDSDSDDEWGDPSDYLGELYDYYSQSEDDIYDYEDDDEDMLFGLQRRMPRPVKVLANMSKNKTTNSDNSSSNTCIVYFTKNGERVGETECSVPKGGFCPVVAMLSPGERIRVNFNPLTG